MRKTLLMGAGGLLALAVGVGCAGSPANELAPGQEGAPGVRTFLLCAPNTALALPAELQDGTAPLRTAIEDYLRSHGREVEWIDLFDAKRLWNAAMARARAEGEIERATAIFARELGQRFDFQAIVMPSVFVHRARTSYSSASWDGVHRRMRTINAPRRPTGRAQSTLADGIAYGGVSGDMAVTSLHVMVFSREGERIFEGRGGLEFVHAIDLAPLARSYRYELSLRDDLFRDPEVLQEGISIAFTPYLPPIGP